MPLSRCAPRNRMPPGLAACPARAGWSWLFFSAIVVILIGLLIGAGIGAVNGMLVTRFRVAPFIATLGVSYAIRGFAELRSNGATFPNLNGSAKLGNTVMQPVQTFTALAVQEANQYLKSGSTGKPEKQLINCILITAANAHKAHNFSYSG